MYSSQHASSTPLSPTIDTCAYISASPLEPCREGVYQTTQRVAGTTVNWSHDKRQDPRRTASRSSSSSNSSRRGRSRSGVPECEFDLLLLQQSAKGSASGEQSRGMNTACAEPEGGRNSSKTSGRQTPQPNRRQTSAAKLKGEFKRERSVSVRRRPCCYYIAASDAYRWGTEDSAAAPNETQQGDK